MCRLFGLLSITPSNPAKYLVNDPCSLLSQSNADPFKLQGDGWGIGFYINGSLRVIKSERPVYEEQERFRSLAEKIKSNIIIAHIRRASNPRGLPRERLISVENSQPFYYGKYVFAHNGVIMIPDEVAEFLGEWRARIRGLNDSEVYFWYIMKEVHEGRALPDALRNFERTLWDIWLNVRDKHLDKTRPYIGLNMVFSDGGRLYAYCKYDEELDGAVKSLCYRDQPGMQMVYSLSTERLVVSSEKTNVEEDWRPLESGQLLTGYVENGKIMTTKIRV
ncbi:MAG: class II glutamine amidotransferase [Candidatus Bathyarchaeia archaeon]